MNIPDGYQGVMPYLMLDDAAAFIEFVKEVFDAEVKMLEMGEDGKPRHCEVIISDSVIMFSNTRDAWEPATANMFVYVDDADARYKKAVDAGSRSIMPPADQEYGRSCGVEDPHGNVWWITTA